MGQLVTRVKETVNPERESILAETKRESKTISPTLVTSQPETTRRRRVLALDMNLLNQEKMKSSSSTARSVTGVPNAIDGPWVTQQMVTKPRKSYRQSLARRKPVWLESTLTSICLPT